MYKYILIFIIIFFGCEEERDNRWPSCEEELKDYEVQDLWIDSKCSNRDTELILRAVDKLNDMSNGLICQPKVNVVGTMVVDHDDINMGGAKHVAVCYNYEPDWYKDSVNMSNHHGYCKFFHSFRLFFFKTSDNKARRLGLIMHELGHYVGMRHSNDPDAMMHQGRKKYTNYQEADADEFCKEYECVN